MEKLELKHVLPYVEHNVSFIVDMEKFTEGNYKPEMREFKLNVDNIELCLRYGKLNLRPLSDLTKEINYGLSTYTFTDLFEIGDCDGCIFEFEHGNIKTIEQIKSISKYNSYNDINYLPNAVVNMMYEYHFDVFGLIPKGLADNINTL